jgi:hypothetical protein
MMHEIQDRDPFTEMCVVAGGTFSKNPRKRMKPPNAKGRHERVVVASAVLCVEATAVGLFAVRQSQRENAVKAESGGGQQREYGLRLLGGNGFENSPVDSKESDGVEERARAGVLRRWQLGLEEMGGD